MDALTGEDSGTFTVRTETSSYTVMLGGEEDLLIRVPGQGLGAADGEDPHTSDLRQDTRPITLSTIDRCVVGEPAVFVLALPDDVVDMPGTYVCTFRRTTIVRSIERVS